MWIRRGMTDNGDNQNAGQQQKLNQEQPLGQRWATLVEMFGFQPNAGDRENEDGNSQNLRWVKRPAAHQQGSDHHEVARHMGGEQLEAHETNNVNHARNYAEHRWKTVFQSFRVESVVGRRYRAIEGTRLCRHWHLLPRLKASQALRRWQADQERSSGQ